MSTKKIDIANDILDYLLDAGYITLESGFNNYDAVKDAAAQLIVKRLQDYIIVQGQEVE
jgi:hypothetical protein